MSDESPQVLSGPHGPLLGRGSQGPGNAHLESPTCPNARRGREGVHEAVPGGGGQKSPKQGPQSESVQAGTAREGQEGQGLLSAQGGPAGRPPPTPAQPVSRGQPWGQHWLAGPGRSSLKDKSSMPAPVWRLPAAAAGMSAAKTPAPHCPPGWVRDPQLHDTQACQ